MAARASAVVALAIGLALLTLGCATPEQRVSAAPVVTAPVAVVVEAPSTDAAVAAPAEVANPTPVEEVAPSEPDMTQAGSLASVDAAIKELRPTLSDRSGQRLADDAPSAADVAAAAERSSTYQALNAVARPGPEGVLVSQVAVQVTPKPTPKPVVKAPAPKPVIRRVASKPVVPVTMSATGSWRELPNVRPIPSAYYSQVHHWDPLINRSAAKYHVDPDLIRRIIYIESKGYYRAYNGSTGVKGLMQIAPIWWKNGGNPYDPGQNIDKGTWIISRGYSAYHTWYKAVLYFHLGPLRAGQSTSYAGLIWSPIIKSL